MKDTYYEVFGVSRNIIIHELKKKYKELILKVYKVKFTELTIYLFKLLNIDC